MIKDEKSCMMPGKVTSGIEKYIFILNPAAGRQRSDKIKEYIEKKFESDNRKSDCLFFYTRKPRHATEIAKEYSSRLKEKCMIIACGGDGTVNEVVNGIYGTKSLLGIIPAGTGNDFVKTVYSERRLKKIIDNFFEYKVDRIDCACIGERKFINVASLGFDSLVAAKAKKIVAKARFLGRLSYIIAALICLFGKNYSRMKYIIETVSPEGEKKVKENETDFILAAFANGKSYGGMFTPCPDACVKDGLLDACIVGRLSVLKILYLLPGYMKGTHTNHPAVTGYKVISALIEGVGEDLSINCDGESFTGKSAKIYILPEKINIAVY